MKCPDCGNEMVMNLLTVGKIEPMIPNTGRTLESRDETHFCMECGLHVTAALTITRAPKNVTSSPQVIDQAAQKVRMEESTPRPMALPSGPRRLT